MRALTTPPHNPAIAGEADNERPGCDTSEPAAERWREENRAALESWNSCANKHDFPLTRHRLFCAGFSCRLRSTPARLPFSSTTTSRETLA